jgi:threonine aldolase
MYFKSDNTNGASQEILKAIFEANAGYSEPYGEDLYSKRLIDRMSKIFEKEVEVALVSSGTAANALALSAMTPSYGSILCHRTAHIYTDECGAPDLFTGGAKTVLIDGPHGKMSSLLLKNSLNALIRNLPRENKPSVLSVTQGTEKGTLYQISELRDLTDIAKDYGLLVHMDGARFSNALVSLGVTPAEMTWKAGVDVLCLGATKNGAIAAEAIVFFKKELAIDFRFRQKRAGQVFSKSRFFSAQMLAFFENQLWLRNASHANAMAKILVNRLVETGLVSIVHPVEINEVFVRMPNQLIQYLLEEGFKFYMFGDDCRFVTSFDTRLEDLEKLLNSISSFQQRFHSNWKSAQNNRIATH